MKNIYLLFAGVFFISVSLQAQELYNYQVKGTVRSAENNKPLAAATLTIKNTTKGTTTDDSGHFFIRNIKPVLMLKVSCIGYESKEITVDHQDILDVYLKPKTNALDETVIMAYGVTTKRLNTGNISVVTSEEIQRQPISNPLAALEGRVPGLLVSQSNGLPGSNFIVQLRGKNSLSQGTQPLYIVDGIPYDLNTSGLSQIGSPANQSPLNSINPADIKSISILKDADATAIYGSQGANGVILITTKEGKPGKITVNVNYYTGIGKITRSIDLLNTSQYLMMRREAFANDGKQPTATTAPDLLSWDTTRYTDWEKMLIGGTANISNLQASLSGGSENINYLASLNNYREKTVFPQAKPSQRITARLKLSHHSADRRFSAIFNIAYAQDLKKMPYNDLTKYIYLPPNAPPVYDASGKLSWTGWISGMDNPLSYTLNQYKSETDNLTGQAILQYNFYPGIQVKINAGYNFMELNEAYKNPIKAQRPSDITTGVYKVGTNTMKSWILEPQVTYTKDIGKGALTILAGSSFQQRNETGHVIIGSKYTDDDLLGDLTAAGQINASSQFSQYNYMAIFGRANYNWNDRYLINVNVRRDGSSRFGPENRFANFWDIGGAWIFSEENFIKKDFPFLSYGKIRSSYGVSGNDQIGDYQYLDSWSTSIFYQYDEVTGILPNKLFNPFYEWERTKKFEVAVDLGFLGGRILLSTSYYRNRSDNQLLYHGLPLQTGFSGILQNMDALIQNSGWEIEWSSKNINSKTLKWQTHINLTIPQNKLISYPDLETSIDRYSYEIGQPLNIQFGYKYLGIDGKTGIYEFKDTDNDGAIRSPADLQNVGKIAPSFYGGIDNNFSYKNWSLDFLIQFIHQTGKNYLTTFPTTPGMIGNQPKLVLTRWQRPGDKADIEQFTASAGTDAYDAYRYFKSSSAIISNASFIRLKNISFSYSFPLKWIQSLKGQSGKIYFQAHNLFTITRYKGADPETQSLLSLPPLKILTLGVQLTF